MGLYDQIFDRADVVLTAESRGPGMQPARPPSGIILTHKPTGWTFLINSSNSQLSNRGIALKKLARALSGMDI